jgi:pyruvate formate lyase activating enzyme
VLKFLKQRQGFLDGVVFSGGEPLLQRSLPEMVKNVVAMGFDVALHTTGSIPARFQTVLPKLSWVGFDIKAPLAHYEKITGIAKSGSQALESLELLLDSGIDYEVRTTIDPKLLNQDDILNLATTLSHIGVKHYVLQQCRPNQANITHHINSVDLIPNCDIATQLDGIFDTFSIRTF